MRYPVLYYLTHIVMGIAVGTGIVRYKRLGKDMKLFLLFLILALAVSLIGNIIVLLGIRHVYMTHLYTPVEFVFMMLVMTQWHDGVKIKRFFYALTALYLVVWIVAKLTFEKFEGYDNFSSTLNSVVLIPVALFTMITAISKQSIPTVNNYRFWCLTGILVYYTGTVIFFAGSNLLIGQPLDVAFAAWMVEWAVVLIAYLFYMVSFLWVPRQ